MSTWGTGVFACDTGADVYDEYRDLLEDQVPDEEANARIVKKFADVEYDEVYQVWLALAAAQFKFGRVDPSVRDRAIKIIDSGEGLGWWTGRDLVRRRAALAKLRVQLTGPQKPRRVMRKPRRRPTNLQPG
jgi:hypothetical protein